MNPVKTIIPAFPKFSKAIPRQAFLNVSEFFFDTIQGENFVGYPAAFLRLQGCILNCSYCDSTEVWRVGNPYTFAELFEAMEEAGLLPKLVDGQHLVITGGSPLLQQTSLIAFLQEFIKRYRFQPFIEIENECAFIPKKELIALVSLWNNSPKLKSSGNAYFHKEALQTVAALSNSWFKFVISKESDWEEIQSTYLDTGLLSKKQLVLMPEGADRKRLAETRDITVQMAIKHNVRYTSREHIVLWDKKTGV